jgi:formylmethanofuran dehydrogenase subunit C
MSGFRFTLQASPSQRLDLSPLTPDRLAGKTRAEVAAIPLTSGNRTLLVHQVFKLEGEPGPALVIEGDGTRLDRIGEGMTQGSIQVRGNVGAWLGARMNGGTIVVEGSAGAYAGSGMQGGFLRIQQHTGDFLAAAAPGDHQGMRGGVLVVSGNAGARAGDRMRRGTLIINGDVGDYCASRMVAGTIAVGGAVGRNVGLAMRRGTLLLRRAPAALLPTFNDCGGQVLPILRLLARAWRRLPGPFASLPTGDIRARRYLGDLANNGRGEILILLQD